MTRKIFLNRSLIIGIVIILVGAVFIPSIIGDDYDIEYLDRDDSIFGDGSDGNVIITDNMVLLRDYNLIKGPFEGR